MFKIKSILVLFFTLQINLAFAKQINQDYENEFEIYEKSFSQGNAEQIYDPLEKMNRGIFYVNNKLDDYALEPLAKGYRSYIPKPIRKPIKNFIANLTLPVTALNSFAQGKTDNALASISNFLINSTIGIGGLFDVASEKNIKYNREDFGQTLAYYNVNSGPFLMLPIFGPSTLRDTGGMAFDVSVDFMGINSLEIGGSHKAFLDNETRIAYTALSGLDKREGLIDIIDETKQDSFDVYASLRSLYIQNRNSKIAQ